MDNFSGSKIMAETAVKKNIPKEDVMYETVSYDTVSNMIQAIKIMQKLSIEKAAVIGSGFHVFRAKKLYADMIKPALVRMPEVSFISYPYSDTKPAVSRLELLDDFHYNISAYLMYILFPDRFYLDYVKWIRH